MIPNLRGTFIPLAFSQFSDYFTAVLLIFPLNADGESKNVRAYEMYHAYGRFL